MDQIKIFSPASVANVSCGFDVLGFCLDRIGDVMKVKKIDKGQELLDKVFGRKKALKEKLGPEGFKKHQKLIKSISNL